MTRKAAPLPVPEACVDALRSATMRAVKSKDTRPERLVRSLAHRLGFRFRLHRADLPGSPDLVFPGRRAAVFVHGCFWHGHDCRRGARAPKTNAAYWRAKIARNRARDETAAAALAALGWRVLTIWECETADAAALERRLSGFLRAGAENV
ncbi:very short patch repair endonuclease [Methylocella sp.]|uniref:very short patch repair endonuclease n=1 Tax=Methylocella sp. TaxID=1978226 RepID=UPI003783963C